MQKILKISQQTFWQIIVKLITTISGLVILSVVSRNYNESGTGDFTLALTFLAFFYILADFGFNAEVLHRVKKEDQLLTKQEFSKLFSTRIIWSLLLLIASLLITLLLPSHFSLDFKLSVILGSLIIVFYAINQTAQAIFQFLHRYDLDILPTILGVILGTLLIYYLGFKGYPLAYLILGYTLMWLTHAFFAGYFSWRLVNFKFSFDFYYLTKLFKTTWPIAGTLALNTIYFRVDSFILSYYSNSAEVGVYNLAYQFFQTALVLPTFIMNSFYPMMLETFKANLKVFQNQIKLAFLGLLVLGLFGSFLTYLTAPILIKIITSNGFSGSVTSLQILSLGFPAYFLSALLMWVMVTKKMYKTLFIVYLLGLLFNLIANLIFIPQYFYVAASWITGISEYLILGLQIVILCIKL